MTGKNIYKSLGSLDQEFIMKAAPSEAVKRKKSYAWAKFASIAACFALIVGSFFAIPFFRNSNGAGIQSSPVIFEPNVLSEKLTGNSTEFIVGSSVSIKGSKLNVPPRFQFGSGSFAVKAKVVKNHPDIYYKLDISSEDRPVAYRLIQMQTIDVIYGKNMPEYFLYMIEDSVYVDMSSYDFLLVCMSQIGAQNYVLRNETDNTIESFPLPVFADRQYHPELGNIIAFTDGVFDESLWQEPNWIYGYQFAKHYLDDPESNYLVVYRGDTEKKVISAIKKQREEQKPKGYKEATVKTLDFASKDAKEALKYVSPFENGVFSQTLSENEDRFIFRRFINGCQTEETVTISIKTEKVTYSEVKYTKDDIEKAVDVSKILSNMAREYEKELPPPAHIDTSGKKLLCLNLYAWYAKVDGKLYGVIKTAWRYADVDTDFYQYYDDAYVLYDMTEGTNINISREDLINIVGNRNVYMFQYGEYGEKFETPQC